MPTCSRCKKTKLDTEFVSEFENKILKTCFTCRSVKGKNVRNVKLTDEQSLIVTTVLNNDNTRVFAKAGTGKTTVAIEVANQSYKKNKKNKILLLTYNKALKDEVKSKVENQRYIMVQNYHTLGNYLFGVKHCNTDDRLRDQLNNDFVKMPKWKIIIIDEGQDMKRIHYDLVYKVIKASKKKPTLLIMGDPFQRLYDNAGEWYINADSYFSPLYGTKFINLHLSYSFRISHEMAEFVNTYLNPNILVKKLPNMFTPEEKENIEFWWGNGIHASPYRKYDPDSIRIVEKSELKPALTELYANSERSDTIVLSYTLAKRSPAEHFSNQMSVEYGEPKLVDRNSFIKKDSRMRIYSTIHQVKGREFPIVCFPDMSDFWLKRADFACDPMKLFNIYYVGVTRAKDKLLLCHTYYDTADKFPTHPDSEDKKEMDIEKFNCSVKSLTEFVPVFENKMYSIETIPQIYGTEIKWPIPILAQGVNYSVELDRFLEQAFTLKVKLLSHKKSINGSDFILSMHMVDNIYHEVIGWLQYTELTCDSSWDSILRFSVALYILETRHVFLWKQITDKMIANALEKITYLLDTCSQNILDLLKDKGKIELSKYVQCNSGVEQYNDKYESIVYGYCPIYLEEDNSLVILRLSNNKGLPSEEIVMLSLIYTHLLQETNCTVNNMFIYYANLGSLHQVIPNKDISYIFDQVLMRKCN